jgi:hypothetical protein
VNCLLEEKRAISHLLRSIFSGDDPRLHLLRSIAARRYEKAVEAHIFTLSILNPKQSIIGTGFKLDSRVNVSQKSNGEVADLC